MEARKAVMYRRVSTQKQGSTGYGLDEQEVFIEEYANRSGFLIPSVGFRFKDVDSGSIWSRKGLDAAIARAQEFNCPIIVQSTDRIGRDVELVASVLRQASFIDAQLGEQASPMFIKFKAIFAEEERNLAKRRTKAALAAAKRRGVKLGNPNIAEARKVAEAARKTKADNLARAVVVELLEMMAEHQIRRDAAGIVPKLGPSEFDPREEALIVKFDWMCQNGTFNKEDFCKLATSRTGNGRQYNRRSLDIAINRVVGLLELGDVDDAATLLSLTKNRAGFAGWDDASRANQVLEASGNYQGTIKHLVKTISNL